MTINTTACDNKKVMFAVLCSGKGSNLRSIIAACNSNTIPGSVCAVISNRSASLALEVAAQHQIPSHVLDETSIQARDASLLQLVDQLRPDFIVLAGYIKKIPDSLIEKYPERIINIHPSLLPEFGGKGMYGLNVHRAVIEAGKKESGLSIHLVNKEYDKGIILKQVRTEVFPDDTPEALASRILELEHTHYPLAIREFILEYF
jgi:phosphoribosylglycinamide formyltransferase 1